MGQPRIVKKNHYLQNANNKIRCRMKHSKHSKNKHPINFLKEEKCICCWLQMLCGQSNGYAKIAQFSKKSHMSLRFSEISRDTNIRPGQ